MSQAHILCNALAMQKHPGLLQTINDYIHQHNLDWQLIPPAMDGLETQIQDALDARVALLAIVGGDGSVHQMANALARSDSLPEASPARETAPVLGIIPAGTGNDFCRAAGIPKNTLAALDVLRTGRNRLIDLGRCNGKIFINVAGMGFDARVVKNALPYKAKGLTSSRAYLRSVFYTLRHMEFYPIVDCEGLDEKGDVPLPHEMLLVAAGNGHYIGGGMKVTPLAELDDGLLDICLVDKVSTPRFLGIFPGFLRGRHLKAKDAVHYQKVQSLKLQFDRSIPMQLDGELTEADHFHVEALPRALTLRVPQ